MTEESIIKVHIRTYLQKLGWYYRAIAANQFTRGGIPDAFAIKNGVTLFIEVKSEKGKLSPEQIQTGSEINSHGGNYIVARSVEDVIEYLYGDRQRTI